MGEWRVSHKQIPKEGVMSAKAKKTKSVKVKVLNKLGEFYMGVRIFKLAVNASAELLESDAFKLVIMQGAKTVQKLEQDIESAREELVNNIDTGSEVDLSESRIRETNVETTC